MYGLYLNVEAHGRCLIINRHVPVHEDLGLIGYPLAIKILDDSKHGTAGEASAARYPGRGQEIWLPIFCWS